MEVGRMQGMFQGLDIAASGMTAEMQRAEIVASNISNMNVTRGPDGEPYLRKAVTFEEALTQAADPGGVGSAEERAQGVRISRVYEDHTTPFVPRYDPGHPHADKDGFVLTSNVDLFREMVDMMSIERSYQANLTSMRSYRQMLKSTLDNMRT